jgi:hypothetical protein
MYGAVQSLVSMVMATKAELGASGSAMSIFFGGEAEGMSMMLRKTHGYGGCLDEPILERASASSFFFCSTHSTK